MTKRKTAPSKQNLQNLMKYGYGVFFADGQCLELEKYDDSDKFKNDRDAAIQCKKDASNGDKYALNCIYLLSKDYKKRKGLGRDNDKHDMDLFNLWGILGN